MSGSCSGAVLVTGGARRIGRAISEYLAGRGWNVVVHYNGSASDADDVVTSIRTAGGSAVAVAADLVDEDAVREMVSEASAVVGPLKAVVNNASVFKADDPMTDDRLIWDLHMAVHVRAPFVLSQELARQVSGRGQGAVVNVIDQRVLNPSKHFTSYTISKMALWDQTQVLARSLAPAVRVNAVGPGPVLPSTRQADEDFLLQAAQTPLARAVDPTEIAAAVAFLLDAPGVTGQMIAVDSGQHLNWAFETEETAPRE